MFRVIVTRNGVKLGELTENDNFIVFAYSENIKKENYIPSLGKPINTASRLFPVFENMLPEHEQLEILKAKHRIKNNIEILLYLENIHGTFDFFSIDEYANRETEPKKGIVWNDKLEEILRGDYKFPNILDYTLDIPSEKLYPKEFKNNKLTGLSGFQYKFSVTIDGINKIISTRGSGESEYIMKPYNKGYSTYKPKDKDSAYIPYLLINEHLFMSFAKDLGFKIPYNAIIKDGYDYHYIIKRYDRYRGHRIDHHEMLTLLEKHSSEKYKVSAAEVLEKASEFLDSKETREMFRFFIFSVIIAHGDFHAKNISLIYKTNSPNETQKQLAPLYDISTVKIYKDVSGADIGMKIKNKNHKISQDDLIWLGSKISIGRDEVINFIDTLAAEFKNNFLNYVEVLPKEIKGLPIYQDRYKHYKTFDVVLKKYFTQRVSYIDKYLIDVNTKKENLWA